jgi:hypothetical protein
MKCTYSAEASREAWIDAAKSCPYATYFHTPYWYDIISPNKRRIVFDVRFDDGVSVILPIAKIKRMGGLLTDHFSSPGGNYGGWLSTSTITAEHIKHLLQLLISKRNLTFRLNPFDPSSTLIGKLLGSETATDGIDITDDFTYAIDLTKGERTIMSGLTKGHKSAIARAARAGVSVRAAHTPQEWDQYYALYQCSLKRWRAVDSAVKTRNVYSRALFERIRKCGSGNATLWLAFKDNAPIAGAVFFYWNGHAVSWHGSAASNCFVHRPNNLLYWEIMLDAVKRGIKTFDFNPSGGYNGVESFKKHFGAALLSTPVISTKTPLRSLIAALRAKAANR